MELSRAKTLTGTGTAGGVRGLNIPAPNFAPAIFADPASRAVQEMLDRLAPTDATILIIGETGTGKEMAARYVHARSRRRSGPFLAVNCGALSETLAEAELFGHEKGAFTGAVRAQRGWFEAASGGTLLLDEIGDLPLHLQVKLLRVLQEREVTRVGARTSIRVDVRVIAATNIDLSTAIAEKRFREDLYFRLNVATVLLPPLRERREIVPILVHHFLKLYGDRLGRPNLRIGADALATLSQYSWPGNIRELENVIHNAVLLTQGEVIESHNLPVAQPQWETEPGVESLESNLKLLLEKGLRDRESDLFTRVMRTVVQTAFDVAEGNQVRAAQGLGISRNTLRTQLAHLGVIPARRRPADELPAPALLPSGLPKRELRIGYQKFGMLCILKASQTLEKRLSPLGFAVRWTEFPAGPQLLEALQSERIDFGTTGEVPPVIAQAEGAPIAYIAHEPPEPAALGLVVPRDSEVRNVVDLKGKRIQLNKGSNVHYLLVRCLEAYGMSLEDIEPVYAPPTESPLLWRSHDVDAWMLWDPVFTMAQRSNEVRVLLDGTGLVPNYHFHIATRKLAQDHPETVGLLLDELRKMGELVAENPTGTARSLSASMGIDVPALEIAFARLRHGTLPLDRTVIWAQQSIADRFYALGLIPRAISVREAVWSPQ